MRIDIVTDTYAPDVNGVAMTLGRLTDGLRERNHRVHVMHTGRSTNPGETSAFSFALPGYREVRVGMPKPFDLRARWDIKRPDVIYVATESPLGRSAVKVAKMMKIPVVTGFHSNFHDFITRYGMGRLETLAASYLSHFHRHADCTITPSVEVVDWLKNENVGQVVHIGRGVDTELFSPAKRCHQLRMDWGARSAVPVATIVGRVSSEKNFGLAVKVFQAIRNFVPDAVCVVVGDGPLRKKLEVTYPWIKFTGMQTGEDLAKCYASSDVLIFPSETETFGNVLLEGMASGLATVSYDYAASELHVKNNINGIKVKKGDEDAFIKQSLAAMQIKQGHELRLNARETAESLGWGRVIGQFEGEFRRLASESDYVNRKVRTDAKRPKLSCRTVIMSDIHLGAVDSKATEVVDFLKHVDCEKLILNGDIVDGWALQRGGKWTSRHSRVVRKIIKMTEKQGVDVIYLRGNHDDVLDKFLPIILGRIRLVKEHIHTTATGLKYLVVHGDGFDTVSTNHRWLASIGAVGYNTLLGVNRVYNRWRKWRGKPYYSLSQSVKARVKSAVSFISRYEELLQDLATRKGCDGIICGHIHSSDNKQVGDVHYLNSGDWVESLTAIIEHHDGRFELVQYEEFMRSLYGPTKVLEADDSLDALEVDDLHDEPAAARKSKVRVPQAV